MQIALRFFLVFCVAIPIVACKAAGPSPSNVPAPAGSSEAATSTDPSVSIVESTVVVSECPEARSMNIKEARGAIRRLVDPCGAVPGRSVHFSATLQPDGRIELASPSGDPESGLVPTCVLKNKLSHRVALRAACKFDVRLDERK
jgi:hypothetical protein